MNGHLTVTNSGTSVQFPSQHVNSPVAIKALHANGGIIYIGDSGVTTSNGYPLNKDEPVIFDFVGDLSNLWADTSNSGDGLAWTTLRV